MMKNNDPFRLNLQTLTAEQVARAYVRPEKYGPEEDWMDEKEFWEQEEAICDELHARVKHFLGEEVVDKYLDGDTEGDCNYIEAFLKELTDAGFTEPWVREVKGDSSSAA